MISEVERRTTKEKKEDHAMLQFFLGSWEAGVPAHKERLGRTAQVGSNVEPRNIKEEKEVFAQE